MGRFLSSRVSGIESNRRCSTTLLGQIYHRNSKTRACARSAQLRETCCCYRKHCKYCNTPLPLVLTPCKYSWG
jgi:hypothetical protein